jgi:hypothetical protein
MLEKSQDEINAQLENGNNEIFKNFVRTLQPEERKTILKGVKTEELLSELQRRFNSLQRRDRGVRELFNIPEEDYLVD